ncbi:MAG TPA: M23 family metallopeptidase [Geodermatophilus sp.]|nr:M23 family metallopeptidase [Geodermatophilus sp.]
MSGPTGSALLERPEPGLTVTEPAATVETPAPRRRLALRRPSGRAADAGTPSGDGEAAVEPTPSADRRPGRAVPRPPGKRGPLWLAALVAGAVIAAVPGTIGDAPAGSVTSAADYGLGLSDLGLAGDIEDAGVRQTITEAEAQRRLEEIAASRAARTPTTVLPTQGRMTTCFCMRWGSMHYGIDLAGPLGTPIYSATDGVVIRAGRASGYGNAVYIQDADGNVHVYGHMRYYDVRAGDIVHAGDQIAKIGNEGQSTGPHLHYQIHRGGMGGRPIDPEAWLAERGVRI